MKAHFISAAIYRQTGYRGNHPLAIPRIGTVEALCAALGWTGPDHPVLESPVADRAFLERFHTPAYLEAMLRAEAAGRASPEDQARHNLGTLENPVFPGLWQRAATSVGGSVLAADLAHAGAVAYHPAGGTHHGMPDRANGFCFFNDPVFAILRLLDLGRARVVYVDLDAHHGDGVEAAFAADPRVRTISMHQAGRWPFTGALSDGGGACNLPVPAGLNDSEFDRLVQAAVLPLARDFRPDAVVVTMGADALQGDPLSGLMLSNGALWAAVEALVALTPAAVVLGGGGYNPWTLGRAWAGMWARLSGQAIPDVLPPQAQSILQALDCDLVDDDERDPLWLTTLLDARNDGPIRPEIESIVAAHRPAVAAG
ncbi:acetoin utilization protein AcuC [Rhodobacter ferrooxidans]|uniref:Acetoin utilization protein AcuC n=1 Tax=Rhodobacter ferrooxidans TaxID=371731 RepID=C8S1C8_9RHOB|nr:acetoin utilization protein AcuC [Rhodobacter sp. SW2]EEW25326.1 histone deacetylase superfamily [Rhodobacter sp. SW2]